MGKAGSPVGREPHGDGAPVVVRGRESRPHGEGGQATRMAQGREVREMRDADSILTIIRGTDPGPESLESRMRSTPHVRFGGGPTEKGRFDRYLAGGLPYLLTRSSTGAASARTPPFSCAIRVSWSHRSLAAKTTSSAGDVRSFVR